MTDDNTVYLHGATFKPPRRHSPAFWVAYVAMFVVMGAVYWLAVKWLA